MKTYELTYIISPEMTSEGVTAKAQELESAIQGRDGIILRQSSPTAKALSYKIGKSASGFFGILEFQLEPEKLLELKEIISKDRKIMRSMIIIKEIPRRRKDRRSSSRQNSAPDKMDQKVISEPTPTTTSKEKERVELKDIEQKLDELLS